MTCHREHIDNRNEREVGDCRDGTRQQPGNFCLSPRQSSLSENSKMSSYQASVEFDFNQESSDSDLSETAEAIVKCNPESAILKESNAFDSEPEGPYMDEPLADDNWIAQYSREVYEAEQRNKTLQNRFDNIEGLDTW